MTGAVESGRCNGGVDGVQDWTSERGRRGLDGYDPTLKELLWSRSHIGAPAPHSAREVWSSREVPWRSASVPTTRKPLSKCEIGVTISPGETLNPPYEQQFVGARLHALHGKLLEKASQARTKMEQEAAPPKPVRKPLEHMHNHIDRLHVRKENAKRNAMQTPGDGVAMLATPRRRNASENSETAKRNAVQTLGDGAEMVAVPRRRDASENFNSMRAGQRLFEDAQHRRRCKGEQEQAARQEAHLDMVAEAQAKAAVEESRRLFWQRMKRRDALLTSRTLDLVGIPHEDPSEGLRAHSDEDGEPALRVTDRLYRDALHRRHRKQAGQEAGQKDDDAPCPVDAQRGFLRTNMLHQDAHRRAVEHASAVRAEWGCFREQEGFDPGRAGRGRARTDHLYQMAVARDIERTLAGIQDAAWAGASRPRRCRSQRDAAVRVPSDRLCKQSCRYRKATSGWLAKACIAELDLLAPVRKPYDAEAA